MSRGITGVTRPLVRLLGLGAIVVLAACEDMTEPTTRPDGLQPELTRAAAVPTGLAEVDFGAATLTLWPYTGTDVEGAASDPINLLFPGVDLRDVRTALLGLNGDRTAFGLPPVAPFDCTWSDAIGANQSSFTLEHGWQGSAIQLECGDYQPMRFHVRLFDAGDGTVGNAHFEVLIPGTNQHEVLSWELAEQIVTVDFVRSGLLAAAPGSSAMINAAPTFRTINPLIYNGLPVALRGVIGGPLGDVTEPVPMPSNGRGTVLTLGAVPSPTPMDVRENTVLNFGQVIPKPFCSTGPGDFVRVVGPIDFSHHVQVDASGDYSAHFEAKGELEVTPVNPATGMALGESYRARVAAIYTGHANDEGTRATNLDRQMLFDGGAPQRFMSHFQAGSGADFARVSVSCD